MQTTANYQIPYPEPADPADAPDQLRQLAQKIDTVLRAAIVPVGAIAMWAVPAPPTDWLICDGHTELATNFPALALVIAPVGGSITLPDLRGRVPVGPGTPAGDTTATGPWALGEQDGHERVQLADAQTPIRNHDHHLSAFNAGGTPPANSSTPAINGGNKTYALGITASQAGTRGIGLPITGGYYWGLMVGGVAGSVSTATHENLQPSTCVNFIIRAR